MPNETANTLSIQLSRMSFLAIAISALLGLLYMFLSAWSSHNVQTEIVAQKSIEIALQTQIIHVLAVVCLGGLVFNSVFQTVAKTLIWIQYLWLLGIFGFSGMIFLKHLVGVSSLGILTPVGGILLMLGWLLLSFTVLLLFIKSSGLTKGQNT